MHARTEVAAERVARQDFHDAYQDHVVEKGEFNNPSLGPIVRISSRDDFKEHVADVIENDKTQCFTTCATEQTSRQADIYYHAPTNTAVIVPANIQQPATAFRPEFGQAWFDEKLARAPENNNNQTSLKAQQGGIYALHPNWMKQTPNTATDQKTEGTKGATMPETSLFGDFIDSASESLGEIAQGVKTEVNNLANLFSNAHPDSGATPAQLQEAAYFSKAVDDPAKYPPLNEDMKSQVSDRRVSEEMDNKFREKNSDTVSMSKEYLQEFNTEERMQSYLSQQQQKTV